MAVNKKVKVSVIVPTYNEEKNIQTCLASIEKQSYKNIEIIVVDSLKSSDNTYEIAKKHSARVFRYGKERSEQRNYGVNKSWGKYILIIDADMSLSKDVVKECVEMIEKNENVFALIIPEKSYGNSFWAKAKALERNCYIGDEDIEAPRFFLKEKFLELGGFNKDMVSGEDWDLGRRFKKSGKVGRIDSFIFHNEGDLSLVRSMKKKYYYAQKSDSYIEKNVNGLRDIIKFIFRPSYFRNWKMLLSDPVHFVGFLIMKFLEYLVGFLALVGKKSFWKKMITQ